MTELFPLMASNVAMASVLALVALAVGGFFRRPALTHGLWVLVLVKLITPPLAPLPMAWIFPSSQAPAHPALEVAEEGPHPEPIAEPALPPAVQDPIVVQDIPPGLWEGIQPPAPLVQAEDPEPLPAVLVVPPPAEGPAASEEGSMNWLMLAGGTWLVGSLAWLVLLGWRIRRFQRLLESAEPAPVRVQMLAQDLSLKLGVRSPRLFLVQGPLSPMLWVFGQSPRLLLPAGLMNRLDESQQAALIAHELAHWRRGDHLVRWLEIVVLALYWWCPLAWWARTELQKAEEECCDAWVVWALPGAAKAYALALVETVDFLCGAAPVLPPAASGIGHVHYLKRRLTMILRGQTPRALTASGVLILAGLGLVLLPLAPGWGQVAPPVESKPALANNQNNQDNQGNDERRQLQDLVRRLQQEVAELKAQLDQRIRLLDKFQADAKIGDNKLDPKIIDRFQKNDGPAKFPEAKPGGGSMGKGPNQPGGDRLHEIERKLDLLMWEIQNMRREMQGNRQGPGGGFGPQPGGGRPGFGAQGGPPGGQNNPGNNQPRPGGGPGGFGAQGGPPGGQNNPGNNQPRPGGGPGGPGGGNPGQPGGGFPGGGFPGGGGNPQPIGPPGFIPNNPTPQGLVPPGGNNLPIPGGPVNPTPQGLVPPGGNNLPIPGGPVNPTPQDLVPPPGNNLPPPGVPSPAS